MDLNASPQPDDEEENFYSQFEDEPAPKDPHQESSLQTFRREREERRERLKRDQVDDRHTLVSRNMGHSDAPQWKKQKYDKSRLPPGWLDCPDMGDELFYLIPSKVPLGEAYNDCIPPGKRFSFLQVFKKVRVRGKRIGMIVDLTNTDRYYNHNEFKKEGVKHLKIRCQGRDSVPDNESVNKFVYERLFGRYIEGKFCVVVMKFITCCYNTYIWKPNKRKLAQSSNDTEINNMYSTMSIIKGMFTRVRILFGLISGSVFLGFTGLFFYLYGWEFLNEALLYHLTRIDPRHNFSIYFYHIYLKFEDGFSILEKLVSFLPQFAVQLVLIFRFALDLPFCFLVQTIAFVAFNKVITAQYFVWFFSLLPVTLPWNSMKLKWEGVLCIMFWIGAQSHWLLWGYLLEFKGKNVFMQLWVAGLLFLAANVFVLIKIIRRHNYTPLFQPLNAKKLS